MPPQTFIILTQQLFDRISRWAEEAYPHEGCGLLIGRFRGPGKEAVRLASVTNLNRVMNNNKEGGKEDIRFETLPEDRRISGGQREFVMDPSDFNRETLQAEKEGLDIIGVIHTHPDHPPRPSQIDASQPFLAQWSNIIVSVQKGKTKEMKSWFRETDNQPFTEETIKIEN